MPLPNNDNINLLKFEKNERLNALISEDVQVSLVKHWTYLVCKNSLSIMQKQVKMS